MALQFLFFLLATNQHALDFQKQVTNQIVLWATERVLCLALHQDSRGVGCHALFYAQWLLDYLLTAGGKGKVRNGLRQGVLHSAGAADLAFVLSYHRLGFVCVAAHRVFPHTRLY